MSGKSSGRTSRSSTSPQPAALFQLSYQSSGINDDTQAESTQPRLNAINPPSNAIDEVQATNAANGNYEDYGHVRKRPRHSGGFLLRSAFDSGYDSLRTKDMSNGSKGQAKDKGKMKADGDELSVQKRRHLHRNHQFKPSIGSSPLANEVLSATSATGTNDKGLVNGVKTLSAASKAGHSVRSSIDSNEIISSGAQSEAAGSTSIEGVPALGFNTDPAQIVNLALSLSESRRRNFSGGLLSPAHTLGDNRVISAGSLNSGFSSLTGGGNLRQQLEQQRRISRHISPRASKRGSRASPSPQPSQESKDSGISPVMPDIELTARPDLIFTPSDATLSRAEKARVAIELGYEYRRLLQYLPKIPLASEERPKTARSARRTDLESSQELGRPYNPLQYIRNRKVRLRQGRALESEAERWKEVDRVRNWVDTVGGEREAGIATIDDRFPLPPFESVLDQTSIVDGMPSLITNKQNTAQNSKPRRPRIEWVFSNWDLLADAYWLQHDGNIAHIEDRRGNKILAKIQNYKGSSARTSAELDRASQRRSDSISRQAMSPGKYRSLMDEARKESSKERSHQETQYIESEASSRHAEGLKDRKSRWPRKLMRSHSTSSSGESSHGESSRHKLGLHRDQDYMDSAILEKHMKKLLEQEIHEKGTNPDRQSLGKTNLEDSKLDAPRTVRTANGNVAKSWSPSVMALRLSKESDYSIGSNLPSTRTSLEEPRGRRPRTSIDDDLDVTAPNSPISQGSLPRFTLHPSRPSSPPSLLRKAFHSRSRSRAAQSNEEAISETDFALGTKELPYLSRPSTRESKSEHGSQREKATASTNGFLSPTTAEGISRRFRRSDGSAKKSPRESGEPESKIRGFLRSSRITELVGNEVSRVGDKFWRKDASNQAPQVPSPASSVTEESDTESEFLDSSPEVTLPTSKPGKGGQDHASLEKPRYHLSNLPTFRSPFAGDQSPPDETSKPTDTNEEPSTPLTQRGRQRSSRFERLAPPKLDMRNVSSTPHPPMTRTQTRNTVPSYDPFDSRQSSASRSEGRVRDADRRLNAVLGIPGTISRRGPPITGLATLGSQHRHSKERPAFQETRQWSIGHRSVSNSRGVPTKRDIARVRVLLLSSGVKANEISRHAHEVPDTPSSTLQNLQRTSKVSLPRVPRSEEHNLVARIYASKIDLASQQLREAAERFSNESVENLQKQIKDVDERVTQKLTPSVRACADEADAFSAQLTTTHVLEVKQLNDSVDAILRKRRRRLRWIRRGAYVLLEWTLLGIMWWVWLIVVILRVIRGTARSFTSAVRWILWL